MDDSTRDFLAEIKGTCTTFPEGLFIDKLPPVKLIKLAVEAEKTVQFKKFLGLGAKYNLNAFGLIFPVTGRKEWVMHNYCVEPAVGQVRLIVPSRGTMNNIHITSLTTFMQEKANGTDDSNYT